MRYRKYGKRPINRDKYSIEQTNFITPLSGSWANVTPPETDTTRQASYQYSVLVVPPLENQGMRKVKHLTISLCNAVQDDGQIPLFYAIVYVPQGYEPQPLYIPANGYAIGNYEANQFIMSSGVIDFSAGPCRIRSPLSRNLNSGDSIHIIFATIDPRQGGGQVMGQISYAVTLQ